MRTSDKDLKTVGYVLRRTNYGEADRILNIITPQGKVAVMAKGVRKEKSKLAGGIEMLARSEFNIHLGRGDLGVLTSAKMQKFHSGIIKDLTRMELAAEILKKVSKASEQVAAEEYFELVDQSLTALGEGEDLRLVEAWFLVRLKKIVGEEINLYRDTNEAKLVPEQKYDWDSYERAFRPALKGEYGANEIKLLRLMATNELGVVRRVKNIAEMLGPILKLAQEGEK